jgi:hypothetical protein
VGGVLQTAQLLGGPVGYGHLATALNIGYAHGQQAAGQSPSHSAEFAIAVITSLAITLLTSVLPFELLINRDAAT